MLDGRIPLTNSSRMKIFGIQQFCEINQTKNRLIEKKVNDYYLGMLIAHKSTINSIFLKVFSWVGYHIICCDRCLAAKCWLVHVNYDLEYN